MAWHGPTAATAANACTRRWKPSGRLQSCTEPASAAAATLLPPLLVPRLLHPFSLHAHTWTCPGCGAASLPLAGLPPPAHPPIHPPTHHQGARMGWLAVALGFGMSFGVVIFMFGYISEFQVWLE